LKNKKKKRKKKKKKQQKNQKGGKGENQSLSLEQGSRTFDDSFKASGRHEKKKKRGGMHHMIGRS